MGFSEQSLNALDQSLIFAKAVDSAEITILAVIEEGGVLRKTFAATKNGKTVREKVSAKLKEMADEYSAKTGLIFKSMVAEGVVYEEIARVSDLIEADLVVMGTNGKPQNLKKRFIGSNAYRTALLVKPPVVTIKGVRDIEKIETIIFPLFEDRHSKEKVGSALKYARLFDARIIVVAVKKEDTNMNILRGHINQVTKFISEHEVKCEQHIIEHPKKKGVVREILNYSYEVGGDLVIITEEDGLGDLTDMILGNDMQSVIYHSEIPVMSVTRKLVKYDNLWDSF